MNQCVPSWELEENHHAPLPPPPPADPKQTLRAHSNSSSLAPDVPTLDYEVAELTWENGQLAMHGLGLPRLPNGKSLAASPPAKYNSWEKQPPVGGTLESIVNPAAIIATHRKSAAQSGCRDCGDELVPWFEDHRRAARAPAAASLALTMDALVPCNNSTRNDHREPSTHVPKISACPVGCSSTCVGSCSAAAGNARLRRMSAAAAAAPMEWGSKADQSASGSATCGRDSRQVTLDTCDREFGTAAYTSTSFGSPENTSSGKQCTKTVDDQDSPCQSRYEREAGNEEQKKKGNGKSSVSTKRSRAAAVHNQSERKRRDKINQRMKTLQKLVPNSSKTDKASMLDEVIEYLKQLQAQVNIMSRMNMSPMMLPLALQQQLQMSMMASMGMGVNMGMGMGVMDLNSIGRSNIAGLPPLLHPTAYMPATSAWDGLADRLAASTSQAMPDPLAAFLACQSQPMTMDAYSRMAALYQQFQQPPGPASKNK
ncbi:transcription factor UNE10 [Coffea eugenioides]|uniref:transcription factor UNE10 n=1 Tax=Coffea eugenioides TaxID=49369 RepID=UPI000F60C6DD|nr:transcription factor UNE10 [Coffea eugenioides]